MLSTVLQTTRPPFLLLSPASIFLGFAVALKHGYLIDYFDLSLILIGAILGHVSVNTLNEYEDFHSGLDAKTNKTPFSGGSGALVRHPAAASAVFFAAMLSLGACTAIGLYFVANVGFAVLAIGFLGVLIIVSYTRWLNRHAVLCLLAPGFAFGPLMVLGCYVVLTGRFSLDAILISLIPFFLDCNLLLINQIPDVSADSAIGRKHFPIAFGIQASVNLYTLFTIASSITILLAVQIGGLPTLSYLSLLPLLLTLVVRGGVTRHANNVDKLIPYLAANVLVTLTTPILLGATLIYGAGIFTF